MHQSSFSYNVTRAYPFKWFTPTVIIGGILTAILVSFINFASTGYELVATSSSNPNGTVSDLSRLERCNVTEVNIDVLGRFTQSPRNTASSGPGILVHALARCAVDIITSSTESALGPTYVEMKGTYEAAIYPNIKTFLSRNKTESPSLYWGGVDIAHERRFNAAIILKRRANGTNNDTYEETMRNDFFRVRCYVEGNFCSTDDIPSLAAPEKDSWMHPYPKIWNRVNLLGKGMWHTVLADLGRNESGVPNMLTQPELLANLTGGLANEVAWYNDMSIMPKGMDIHNLLDDHPLASEAFDPNGKPQASLGVTDAFFSANYICQVPQTKTASTLFLSILVADLVLLQAVWLIFRFIVDTLAQRKDPTLRHCAGCNHDQSTELADLRKSSSTTALVASSNPPWPSARERLEEQDINKPMG
ncbi:hypothetical protein PG989_013731 [Apiospora arundinis]